MFRGLLAGDAVEITGVAACSTVPAVLRELRDDARRATTPTCRPSIVEPGVRTGVQLRYRQPEGGRRRPDRQHPGRAPPLRRAVDRRRLRHLHELRRGQRARASSSAARSPRASRSRFDALAARAAQLRKVELVQPRSVIGKNTVEACSPACSTASPARSTGSSRRIEAETRARSGRGDRDRRAGPGGDRRVRDDHPPRARPHADRAAAGLRAQHLTAAGRCVQRVSAAGAPRHQRHVRQYEVLAGRPVRVGPGQLARPGRARRRASGAHGSDVDCGSRPARPARRRRAPAGAGTRRAPPARTGRAPRGSRSRCALGVRRLVADRGRSAPPTQATAPSRKFQNSASGRPGAAPGRSPAAPGPGRTSGTPGRPRPASTDGVRQRQRPRRCRPAPGPGSGVLGHRAHARRRARPRRTSTPAAHSARVSCRCRRRRRAPEVAAGRAAAASANAHRLGRVAGPGAVVQHRDLRVGPGGPPGRSVLRPPVRRGYPRAGQVRPIGSSAVTQAPAEGDDPGRGPTTTQDHSRAGAGPPGEAGAAARRRASSPTRWPSRGPPPWPRSVARYPDLPTGHRDRRPGRRSPAG